MGKVQFQVDLDDNILKGKSDQELTEFFHSNVVSRLIEGFRVAQNKLDDTPLPQLPPSVIAVIKSKDKPEETILDEPRGGGAGGPGAGPAQPGAGPTGGGGPQGGIGIGVSWSLGPNVNVSATGTFSPGGGGSYKVVVGIQFPF